MDIKTYKDKVRGCWLGKNIGGTLGAPFECVRGVFDLEFYTTDLVDGVLPNDDLDLQLVWLNASEVYGKHITSDILGEYWLNYISANWAEYGAGKNNMRMGILPPLSGWYNNHNCNSCGAFIRSEIWACLTPGHPEIAAKYAYYDAIVDHTHEGVYSEIFCAVIESAAFSESDRKKIIQIALSYIPNDCGVSIAVRKAIECYENNLDWKAARKVILQTVPGSFGMYRGYQDREVEEDVPTGNLGYDSPSNIGIMIIGLLYGEGDFGKSICIAAGCGEDGDCTAATLGSILGIILGAENIPQKWIAPIGDEIKTISIDLTSCIISIPETITELSSRVCAIMPAFMGAYCDTMNDDGVVIHLNKGDELYDSKVTKGVVSKFDFKDFLEYTNHPFGVLKENSLFSVILDYIDGIEIKEGMRKKFQIRIENKIRKQQWLTVKLHMPNEWNAYPGKEFYMNLDQYHGGYGRGFKDFSIVPNELISGKYEIILEISSQAYHSKIFIPIVLFI